MRIIPVLDLLDGQIVRGVAGRRQEYRPIVSCLTRSTRPVDVARALHERLGATDFYLADLDAIEGKPPACAVWAALRAEGLGLWVDAGVRTTADAAAAAATGIEGLVVGLETVAGPETVAEIVRRWGERVIFSLDLKEGQPLGDRAAWKYADPRAITGQVVAAGVRRLIVLDLARVGVGTGTGTEALCREMALAHPQVMVIAGGGVREPADLHRLRQCGVGGVLVASALHDGRIQASDLAGL